MRKHVDPRCRAFHRAIEVLSRPWTGLILNVLQERTLRFSELKASASGLTDKVLSTRLKELEADGLLERSVDEGPPVRVSYALTRQGRAFNEVAKAIQTWGRELLGPDDLHLKPVRASPGAAGARWRSPTPSSGSSLRSRASG